MRAFAAAAILVLTATGCQSPGNGFGHNRAEVAEGTDHPILPDSALISSFHEHRSAFERLRQMIVADSKLHRVSEDQTDPQDPAAADVSPERIAEYRRLLQVIGCPGGFVAQGGHHRSIYFISGHCNLLIAASTKGYCYLKKGPASTVTDTSTLRVGDDEDAYRRIEDHWYIFWKGF
jgi:hypothetical protein